MGGGWGLIFTNFAFFCLQDSGWYYLAFRPLEVEFLVRVSQKAKNSKQDFHQLLSFVTYF